MENQFLVRRVKSLELVVDEYIYWKKDTKKFKGYMEKKYDKPKTDESKDGTGSLVSNK